MPSDWAASGARLVLPKLKIQFQDDNYQYAQSENWEKLLGFDNDPQFKINVLSLPKFVGASGEETVQVGNVGAYTVQPVRNNDYRYPSIGFRFFLDFPNGAVRNDVKLPAERIFFTSKFWMVSDNDVQIMKKQLNELREKLKIIEDEKSDLNNQDKNGRGVIQWFRKAQDFRSLVALSDRKDILKRRLGTLERALPVNSQNVIRGPNGILFDKEGYMTVKRYAGLLGRTEQYHIVGKFSISNDF